MQVVAWLGVMAVHAGLFWVLTHQGRESRPLENSARLRLLFIAPIRTAPPSAQAPSSLREARTRHAAPPPDRPMAVLLSPPTAADSPSESPATAAELLEQGREWAREQASPSFQSD